MAYLHQDRGDVKGTRLILEKLVDYDAKSMRGFGLLTAAEIYARIGDFERARQLIDSMPSDVDVSNVRKLIAFRQVIAADPKPGLVLAGELRDPDWRSDALLHIAKKQSALGNSAAASDTLFQALAAATEMDEGRGEIMAKIATAWADMGNISQAKQTLEEALEMEKEQASADGDADAYIAVAFAKMGDFTRALELARQLDEESSYTYGHIALEEVEAGQLQHVLDWVSSLKTPEAKAEVLLNASDALTPEKKEQPRSFQ
jgi:thioredoxin-like negative regulator of GroEL